MQGQAWKSIVARIMIACLLLCLMLGEWPVTAKAEGNAEFNGTLANTKPLPEDVASFPVSYQARLYALKQAHPNWVFEPYYVMDFDIAVKNEMRDGKSLIHKSYPEYVKEGAYDQGNWFFASKAILKYYMDPRNSLTESTIFQFEQLTYNSNYHTLEALEAFLDTTFMGKGKLVPETVLTFPFLIYACGKHETITTSPFHLAARILQEQGDGTSPLISGTYPGYEGYYNYFNFGATGQTNTDIIVNGLKYAQSKWGKGAYNAIYIGSQLLAENYIRKGQDSLYLQKFNVNTSTPYTHQYMQNISAPTTEASSIKSLYENANALNSPFVFQIPVYQNMPEEPCPMPTYSTNIVLVIPSNSNDPYNYTLNTVTVDGVDYEAESYYNAKDQTRRLIVTLPDGTSEHAWIEIKDASGNIVRGYYWDLAYYDTYYRATEGTKPTPKICTISFVPNGGSGVMSSIQVNQGTRFTLPECTFTAPSGYEFDTWDCGAPGQEIVVTKDVAVKAVWKEIENTEAAVIRSARAILDGKIGLAFHLSLPQSVVSDPGAYVLFTQGTDQKQVLVSKASLVDGEEEQQYRFEYYFVSSKYREVINLKIFDGQGKPVRIIGNSGTDYTQTGVNYTLETYLNGLINSSDAKSRNLAKAMKDYCAASSLYFNYNVDESVTLSASVGMVGVTQLGGYISYGEGTVPEGITGKYMRLSFEANNALKIYYQFEQGVDPYSYKYKINGKKTTLREIDGSYYVVTKGIPAALLAEEYRFSVTKNNVTYTIYCSPLSYARSIYLNGNEKEKKLVSALYLYYRAAKNYFTAPGQKDEQ